MHRTRHLLHTYFGAAPFLPRLVNLAFAIMIVLSALALVQTSVYAYDGSNSFTFTEHSSGDTGVQQIWYGGGYILDGDSVKSNSCGGYGLSVSSNRSGSYWAYGHVWGTPNAPGSCQVVFDVGRVAGTNVQIIWYITINNINETPTSISLSNTSVSENAGIGTIVGNVGYYDPDMAEGYGGGEYTLGVLSGPFSISGTSLVTSNVFNYEAQSSYGVTLRVTDPYGYAYDQAFTIYISNVNEPPSISNAKPDSLSLLEGRSAGLNISATDPEGNTIYYSVSSQASHGSASFNGSTVNYSSTDSDYYGSDSFIITASDGSLSDTLTVNVTVTPVNDPPSFSAGPDQTINEDAPTQTIVGWAQNASRGPANESGQVLTYTVVSNSNPGLFSAAPSVNSNGVLQYTVVPNAHTSATISLTISDNGGTSDGGDDVGNTVTFTITVSPVNDAPVLTASPSLTVTGINEDAFTNTGLTVTALLATGASGNPISDVDNNAAEGIGRGVAVYGVDNIHGAWQYSTDGTNWTAFGSPSPTAARLLAANGVTRVRFVPNADWNGTVALGLQLRAWDQAPGSGSNGGTANITSNGGINPFSADSIRASLIVAPVNDAPVFDNSMAMTLDSIREDETTSGTLVSQVIASAETTGADRITDVDQDLNVGYSGEGIAILSADNSHGTWQYSINSGVNWNNLGSPSTASARLLNADNNTRLRFIPESNWNSESSGQWPAITFTAWDRTSGVNGGTSNATTRGTTTAYSSAVQSASITVLTLNDQPTFTRGNDIVINEGSPAQTYTHWATLISPGPADEINYFNQQLHFNVLFVTRSELFLVDPTISPDGTLTFTPAPDAYGEATLFITLQDDGGILLEGSNDTSNFSYLVITINGVNDVPSFSAGANQTAAEDSGAKSVSGWATAISAGPANESWQDLTFVISDNTNPTLFSTAPAVSSNGALTYTPALNAYGSATLTVYLHDGGGTLYGGIADSGTQSFTITISPVNDPPVNTVLPVVSGMAYVNETLSATTGTWNDLIDETPGNLSPGTFTYAYQWQRADNDQGANLLNIPSANSAAYTPVFADNGKFLRVKVTATDSATGLPTHQSTYAFSAFTHIELVNLTSSVTAFAKSTAEDVLLRFSAADFTNHFSDTASLPLARVRITRLTETGTLFLDANSSGTPDSGEALAVGQEILAADLNNLAFLTPANWYGSDVFSWNATTNPAAGYPLPGPGATVSITVSSVNDAPILSLPTLVNVAQDSFSLPITFTLADIDVDLANPVSGAYTIDLGCDYGSLQLAVTAGLTFDAGADGSCAMSLRGTLAALQAALGGVIYTPQANYTGQDEIRVFLQDHGSTGSGGALSDTDRIILLVSDVNAAPTNILPDSFTQLLNTSTVLDFEFMDDSSMYMQVTFSALHGSIKLPSTTYLTLVSGVNNSHDLTYRGPVIKMVMAILGVRYSSDTGYIGPDTITFTTNDLGGTGTGGFLSTTSSMSLTVKPATLTFTIPEPPSDTFVVGQLMPVTVHVTVETPVPTIPTGETLTITNASGDSCQATLLASGDATCSMVLSAIGPHDISISYPGSALYNPQSLSAVPGPETIPANLDITIPNPPTGPFKVGELYPVTALVTPVAPSTTIPVGSKITISNGSDSCEATILIDGTATCYLVPSGSGSPDLSAKFTANTLYNTDTSAPVSGPEVVKGTIQVAIPNPPAGPFEVGQPVSITALVTPTAPTTIIPVGETVEIGNGTVHCIATILANGTATCAITPSTSGQPDLSVSYAGGTDFTGAGPASTSGPTVTPALLTISIPNPPTDPIITGQPYSVTILVVPGGNGNWIPIGEKVTISNGTDTCQATVLVDGTATCDITPTTAGSSVNLVVSFNSTSEFSASTSQPVPAPVVAKADTSLAFLPTNNPANTAETLRFRAVVSASAPGSGNPGGKLAFSVDNQPFGGEVDLVDGEAVSIDISTLSSGDHLISVSYAGDLNYNSAAEITFHQMILTPSGASTYVTPEDGGTITFTGFQHGLPVITTIVIPPGAVPEDATIVFSMLDSTILPRPDDLNYAANFTIQVFSAGSLEPGLSFLLPVQVTFGFDPGNFDVNYLTVLGWNSDDNNWNRTGIDGFDLDAIKKTVTFTLTGPLASEYTLAGQTEFFTFLPLITIPIPEYSLQWSLGLGFEDLPLIGLLKNDFDFNDWTVQIDGKSDYAVGGGAFLKALTLDFAPIARGSSYHHSFKFSIPADRFASDGTVTLQVFDANHVLLQTVTTAFTAGIDNTYEIFTDTAGAFPLGKNPGNITNSRESDPYAAPQRYARLSFTFDTAFSFGGLSQMELQRSPTPSLFFNPILDVINTGERIQSSDIRILVIPDGNWKHPEEGIRIDKAYPLVTFTDGIFPAISLPADWWLTFNHCVYDGVACSLPTK